MPILKLWMEGGHEQVAVIATTDYTAHGTSDADKAALLVQQDPDKLEYVSAPNYWNGIDY